MSKTKNDGMTHYEILFIIPNKFTDDEAKKIAEQTERVVTDNGGQITTREYWGKKRLAYEIKQNAFGYYSLLEFDLEGRDLAKVDKALSLSANILRHQIVAKKPKSAEAIARDQKIQEKINSKKAAEEKIKLDREKKAAAPATPETPSRPADAKDLDEKLDNLLSAKDLI